MTRVLVMLCACASSTPAPTQPSNRGAGERSPSAAGASTYVEQNGKTGGVLEMTGDRAAAMRDAEEKMRAHCGGESFTIVREGEELVEPARTATAWRVHYRCR